MAELHIAVDGVTPTSIQDASGHKLAITSNGSINVTSVPEGALPYTTLVEDTASVTTANNYLSIFNPVGSGKTFIFYQFTCFPYATAATGPTVNMEVQRISAASGGTQLAAANINKFDTLQPNSAAEVRTGNPTVTLVGTLPVLAIPPAITSAAVGVSSTATIVPPTGALFICHAGEGLVVRQSAGSDIDERWSMGFTWTEM